MINGKNILYARKVFTLGDFFYWRVLVRFIGDRKETCVLRTLFEHDADNCIKSFCNKKEIENEH